MFDFFLFILVFIFSVFLLILIHEFGHFLAAKKCGVKIERFSLGLGKILWRKKMKSDMEIVISMFPLGGYVRPSEESFNQQSLLKRSFIILAGSFSNLIFALFLYLIIFTVGIHYVRPAIGEVLKHSIAEKAGVKKNTEIIALDNKKIFHWRDFVFVLLPHVGDKSFLRMQTQSLDGRFKSQPVLNLVNWQLDPLHPDLLSSLGIKPLQPRGPLLVKSLRPWGPAAQAGLEPGDVLLKFAGKSWDFEEELNLALHAHAGQSVAIQFQRQGRLFNSVLDVGQKKTWAGEVKGEIGAKFFKPPWLASMIKIKKYSFFSSFLAALDEVKQLINFNKIVVVKMIKGEISLKSLAGPLSLFKGLNLAAEQGLIPFLDFLAVVSVSLAVINLLPIPGLDGAYLVYFLYEKIRGRAVSVALQVLLFRLGIIFLSVILFQALMNDVLRFLH